MVSEIEVQDNPADIAGHDSVIGDCVTGIVAAYVSNNHVARGDLPALIERIHASLTGLSGQQVQAEQEYKATPAQIRKSITSDALISFIDGKTYKTLRRHLSRHGMDPDSYRARYSLPHDYPMVAPSYSETRAALARKLGLGNRGRGSTRDGS